VIKIETTDGEIFQGRSYDEVVEQMASQKMPKPRSLTSYRKSFADRVKRTLGISIRPDTSKSLIEDMEKADMLRRL
jgi:hypothetical protein